MPWVAKRIYRFIPDFIGQQGGKEMVAPLIDSWIDRLKNSRTTVDEKTELLIEDLFETLKQIKPCGDDNRRELWLKADRGTIDDFGDFDEWLDEELVDDYQEFEEWWKADYPDETSWYHLISIEREDYRTVFLGRKQIYESWVPDADRSFGLDLSDLFQWIIEAVQKCILQMQDGVYNKNVQRNLDIRERTGTISRKDFWDIFSDDRRAYYESITESEIEGFLNLISEQKGQEPAGDYQKGMTSGMFYSYCSEGYIANSYNNIEAYTPKELYYRYADGRDEGLAKIDEESGDDFDIWYHDKDRYGGHPWEVCRGGNSTHIDLRILESDKGYYLGLKGKSMSRSVETIKFYIALRGIGVATYLFDSEEITARLLQKDLIGIVPRGIMPVYCESLFPEDTILDFINLPLEKTDEVAAKVNWQREVEQFLDE